ncbi:MAG: response regulator [Promethearchaeota archaeon]
MVSFFVVDDDITILKLYDKILSLYGFEIIGCAQNGKEAVVKFKNFKVKPDFIIIDYHMPLKDGCKAAKEILEIDATVKIIICSGDPSIKEKVLSMGVIDFIEKPFNLKTFQNKIINTYNNSIFLKLNTPNFHPSNYIT